MDNGSSRFVVMFLGESKEKVFCNSRYFYYMLLTHAGGRVTYSCTQQSEKYFPTSKIFIWCPVVYMLAAFTVDNNYELDSYMKPHISIPHKYLQNNI